MTEEILTPEAEPVVPAEEAENDNSGDSSPDEETDTEQTPAPEEDKEKGEEDKGASENLDSHPRWQEREKDWKERFNQQEERHTGEITKLREEFVSKDQPKADETPIEIPSWFGGDKEQFKAYKKDLSQQITEAREGAKEDTLKDISSKSETEKKAIDDATTYYNEQVSEIETDKTVNPEGQKIDRNKLMKFVLDNELVDTKGRWNYRAGFLMMKANITNVKNSTLNAKKKIASATTSEKNAEDKPSAFKTSEDFKNPQERPW